MQAALVLNALPTMQAAKVIARLEPNDIKSVLDVVTKLGSPSAAQLKNAVNRLANESVALKRIDSDDVRPNDATDRMDEALQNAPSVLDEQDLNQPFDFLVDMLPEIRSHLLEDEHPRNIATVLSLLPPQIASATMKSFDDPLRISVLRRMCELEEVTREEIVELRFAIRQRLKKFLRSRDSDNVGVDSAIKMLSCSDRDTQESMLTHFEQVDPDLANKLKGSLIEIEKLETLLDKEIRLLLSIVDTSNWAPALKNASTTLQLRILGCMAKPVAKLLQQEIDELGAVDQELEDACRQNIIQVVLQLVRDGKINLPQQAGQRTAA